MTSNQLIMRIVRAQGGAVDCGALQRIVMDGDESLESDDKFVDLIFEADADGYVVWDRVDDVVYEDQPGPSLSDPAHVWDAHFGVLGAF